MDGGVDVVVVVVAAGNGVGIREERMPRSWFVVFGEGQTFMQHSREVMETATVTVTVRETDRERGLCGQSFLWVGSGVLLLYDLFMSFFFFFFFYYCQTDRDGMAWGLWGALLDGFLVFFLYYFYLSFSFQLLLFCTCL